MKTIDLKKQIKSLKTVKDKKYNETLYAKIRIFQSSLSQKTEEVFITLSEFFDSIEDLKNNHDIFKDINCKETVLISFTLERIFKYPQTFIITERETTKTIEKPIYKRSFWRRDKQLIGFEKRPVLTQYVVIKDRRSIYCEYNYTMKKYDVTDNKRALSNDPATITDIDTILNQIQFKIDGFLNKINIQKELYEEETSDLEQIKVCGNCGQEMTNSNICTCKVRKEE